ncbi:MAG: prepilin-type N-terminal cleavage/methylation domain-containing protein [Candidatus Binatia bacterium]
MNRRLVHGGFTLLELIIAVTVLAVAMMSLLGLHGRNLRLLADAHDLAAAESVANSVAAWTQGGPYPNLGATEGTFDQQFKIDSAFDEPGYVDPSHRFRWKREVAATVFADLRQVTVAVGLAGTDEDLLEYNFLVRRSGG